MVDDIKPVLFASNETEFDTQGLGVLSDAISCIVTEERNGAFELEMEYPQAGIHFKDIADRSIIYALPSPYRSPQPFRIYRITKPMSGIVKIYAQHITYDLSGVPLNPFAATSCASAINGLKTNAAVDSLFDFWTDISSSGNFAVSVPSSTRSVMGGESGSILDIYGGEYEWDKFNIKLHKERGTDNGVVIRYGKNLTDIEQDRNISNVATGIYPYWTDSDGNIVTCEPKIVPADGTYDFTRVVPVDFSQDFEEQPTPQELKKRADEYIKSNKIGVPTVSITASFAQLEQTEEYKDLALLEKCDLCDTVTVQFESLNINVKAKITKIVTNVLTERYESVDIGDIRPNIADTIITQGQEISKKPTESFLQQAIINATNLITGNKGGYVILRDSNGDGEPDEILIMNTPDIQTATKVWRWNNSGLGYSKNGYNGPYSTAITQDGAIVADFITTGVLNASLIKTGIIRAIDNPKVYFDVEGGELAASRMVSSNSNIIAIIGAEQEGQQYNEGIYIYNGNDKVARLAKWGSSTDAVLGAENSLTVQYATGKEFAIQSGNRIRLYIDTSGNTQISGNVTITGNLDVNGTINGKAI